MPSCRRWWFESNRGVRSPTSLLTFEKRVRASSIGHHHGIPSRNVLPVGAPDAEAARRAQSKCSKTGSQMETLLLVCGQPPGVPANVEQPTLGAPSPAAVRWTSGRTRPNRAIGLALCFGGTAKGLTPAPILHPRAIWHPDMAGMTCGTGSATRDSRRVGR